MKLYLLRHGEAQDSRTSDFHRPLTAHGREQAANRAEQLVREGIGPGVIIHSPRVRAVETASYIMERFPNVPTLELSEVIDADRALFDIIRASSFSDPIIVGHNPTISELASSLAGARIQFSTCSFAAFDVDNYPPIEATLSRFYR